MDGLVSVHDGIVETSYFDERDQKMVTKTTYDNSDIVKANVEAQNTASETQRYKGNLVHAARVHMGDIVRLKAQGYDLLSPDPAEVRRALCYLQSNEQQLLTVPGKPFALRRNKWE